MATPARIAPLRPLHSEQEIAAERERVEAEALDQVLRLILYANTKALLFPESPALRELAAATGNLYDTWRQRQLAGRPGSAKRRRNTT